MKIYLFFLIHNMLVRGIGRGIGNGSGGFPIRYNLPLCNTLVSSRNTSARLRNTFILLCNTSPGLRTLSLFPATLLFSATVPIVCATLFFFSATLRSVRATLHPFPASLSLTTQKKALPQSVTMPSISD